MIRLICLKTNTILYMDKEAKSDKQKEFVAESKKPSYAEIQKGLEAIKKLEYIKERHKIYQKKYFQSKKGKAAQRRAYKKYYKPTGRPIGRPRKKDKDKDKDKKVEPRIQCDSNTREIRKRTPVQHLNIANFHSKKTPLRM